MPWDVAPACTDVSQPYGPTDWNGEWVCPAAPGGHFHAGIDLSGAGVFRTPVLATRSGVVTAIGLPYLGDQAVAVYTDERVTIEHGHLDEARVQVGQRVQVGDLLGLLGTKGNSTGPHLHVEVRVDGPFQGVAGCPQNDPTRNPIPYLRASYMIAGVDSSGDRPTPERVAAMRAGGIGIWNGYLATQPANVVGLTGWTKADFDLARQVGGTPIGYCSGWDDPVAIRALAAAWGVRPALDVENGIRGDGPWVQPWLDAAGVDLTGLYGNRGVHAGRRARFYVLAGYPGSDPGTVWPNDTERPNEPVGWQWQGTHNEFGTSIDRCWFESWFLGITAPAPPPLIARGEGMLIPHPKDDARLDQVVIGTGGGFFHRSSQGGSSALADAPFESWGGGPFSACSASATWNNAGTFLNLSAVGENGSIWIAARKLDGTPALDWKKGQGTARVPASGGAIGPAGPPGPAYDDTALRLQLQADLAAAVAEALNK